MGLTLLVINMKGKLIDILTAGSTVMLVDDCIQDLTSVHVLVLEDNTLSIKILTYGKICCCIVAQKSGLPVLFQSFHFFKLPLFF